MAIPEQIRKQTEEVQNLYRELGVEPEGADDSAAQDGDAPRNEDTSTDTGDASREDAPKLAGTEQPPADDTTDSDLLQKYRTLQGMYNAEVPRLHQQLREQTARVQRLEQLLATMQTTAPAAPVATGTTTSLLTDEERDEYGESVGVMRKVSREEYTPLVQKLAQIEQALANVQKVVPAVQTLTQRQDQTAAQQFWQQLGVAVPNWQDINNNADFQTWLLDVDPFTGIRRQTLLEDAQKNLDVARVARFFEAWSGISGAGNGAQHSQRDASATELQRQVSPGKGRNSGRAAQTAGQGKTYSPEDIQKFYDEVRQGRYKGREQERDRIERDIFTAQREGRIMQPA